ncbi:MAG: 2Fe-2S iron-sulfur cluster-binding protein [Xenococcaceae cyanobacterium]
MSKHKFFNVTLVNQAKGIDKTLRVAEEEYVLDIAEEFGIDLPYSCRNAACFTCLGKLLEGTVEHMPKALEMLKREEIEAGYILTCAVTPTSDCKILTHQEEEYLG